MNTVDFRQAWDGILKTEYRKFNNIPSEERMSDDSTLCGLLYIDNLRRSKTHSIIKVSSDNIIYVADNTDFNNFTKEDALYLTRCGLVYDKNEDHIIMRT